MSLDGTYGRGYYYGIYVIIENVGLLIYSNEETKEVPEFLEIAAGVIIDSGYDIGAPKWMSENPESKKYLNVMFQ